jgi:hypothetical protein
MCERALKMAREEVLQEAGVAEVKEGFIEAHKARLGWRNYEDEDRLAHESFEAEVRVLRPGQMLCIPVAYGR